MNRLILRARAPSMDSSAPALVTEHSSPSDRSAFADLRPPDPTRGRSVGWLVMHAVAGRGGSAHPRVIAADLKANGDQLHPVVLGLVHNGHLRRHEQDGRTYLEITPAGRAWAVAAGIALPEGPPRSDESQPVAAERSNRSVHADAAPEAQLNEPEHEPPRSSERDAAGTATSAETGPKYLYDRHGFVTHINGKRIA